MKALILAVDIPSASPTKYRLESCHSKRSEESLTPSTHEPAISEILRVGGGAKALSNGYRITAASLRMTSGGAWMRQALVEGPLNEAVGILSEVEGAGGEVEGPAVTSILPANGSDIQSGRSA